MRSQTGTDQRLGTSREGNSTHIYDVNRLWMISIAFGIMKELCTYVLEVDERVANAANINPVACDRLRVVD